MSHQSTAPRNILFGALLLAVSFLVFQLNRSNSPKPPSVTEITSSVQDHPTENKRISRPTSSSDSDDDFLDEMLAYLPEDRTQETILFNGTQLICVKGDSINEDAITGIVKVSGLKRLELMDGRVFETSPGAELIYDPATGDVSVTSLSISMIKPKEQTPIPE